MMMNGFNKSFRSYNLERIILIYKILLTSQHNLKIILDYDIDIF